VALDDAQEEALREELKKVRDEAAKGRLKRHELEGENSKLLAEVDQLKPLTAELEKVKSESKTALESKDAEIVTKLAESSTAAKEQVKAARLEALALREGLVDLDGLKLLDLSKITQKEDGTFEGVEEVFKAAREAKPYLFGEKVTTTTGTKPAPKPGDPAPVDARKLTKEEYQKEKDALLSGAK